MAVGRKSKRQKAGRIGKRRHTTITIARATVSIVPLAAIFSAAIPPAPADADATAAVPTAPVDANAAIAPAAGNGIHDEANEADDVSDVSDLFDNENFGNDDGAFSDFDDADDVIPPYFGLFEEDLPEVGQPEKVQQVVGVSFFIFSLLYLRIFFGFSALIRPG